MDFGNDACNLNLVIFSSSVFQIKFASTAYVLSLFFSMKEKMISTVK